MNGNVISWMGIASSVSGAIGVLAGRRLEWPSAYRQGVEAGKEIGKQETRGSAQAVTDAQIERWQALMAGRPVPEEPVGRHGHPGTCSHERGCW